MLEVRFEKEGRGGRRPAASKECIFWSFSGELAIEYVEMGEWAGKLSWVVDLERCPLSNLSVLRYDWLWLDWLLSKGVGECSLRAPASK